MFDQAGVQHFKGPYMEKDKFIIVKSNSKINKTIQNELVETTHFNKTNFMYTANIVINQQALVNGC